RELLIQLDGKLEVVGRARRPGARDLSSRLTVECGIHFDGVEVVGVVTELVELLGPPARGRIEDAVPRASAARVVPAGRPDTQIAHPGRIMELGNWIISQLGN